MSKCAHCNAPVKDDVEHCPFCGTTTEQGLRVKQARAAEQAAEQQRAAAEAAAARARADAEMRKTGTLSVIFSLAGTVVCCLFPVGPILGVIFGRRARNAAAQLGVTGPGTLGYWLGVAGLVISVLSWIGVGVIIAQERAHVAELKAKVGTAEKLDLATACALTELAMIDQRYEEFNSLDDYECDSGELEVNGDQAVLRGTSFKKSERVELVSCLQLRHRWTVKQVRADDDCAAPPAPGPKERRRKLKDEKKP